MATERSTPEQESALLDSLRTLKSVQVKLAAFAMLAMMTVTTIDVALRYALNRPIRGAYEFVEAMLVIIVFNGLSAGFFSRSHIVIDLADHIAGRRVQNLLVKMGDLLSLAVLLILAWAMARPAFQAYEYGDVKLELGLPVYVLWIAAAAGMAATILCAAGVLFSRAAGASQGAHR